MATKSAIRTPRYQEPDEDRSGACWLFRPCTDEQCEHLCCQQYREWAEAICPMCGEAIGYDSAHISCDGETVHAGCTVDLLLADEVAVELVKTGETVKIGKQAYTVIMADDCSQYPLVKADNDRYGIAQMVGLQKPNGRRAWTVYQYQDGTFSRMTKI